MELNREFIVSGTLNSQENTWKDRYNSILPDFKKDGEKIIMTKGNDSAIIEPFDEIILTILLKFLFIPLWLVRQCYNTNIMILGMNTCDDKINSWIKLGLIWKESTVTGIYIRPTYALFKLFGVPQEKFYNIPFNTLTHTISEQKVFFDIMAGFSSILAKENRMGHKLLPRVSELGFKESNIGTNIITEPDFRNPYLFRDEGIKELANTENKINNAMKNGDNFTPELANFNQFTLVKKVNNTGEIKKDYKFHLPDLIIPNLRENGQPRSIAIEVELSNKRGGYIETMNRYKDNNKFGSVYWLVSMNSTANALRDAYKEVKGTGSCSTHLLEFVVPTPDF